MSAPNTGIINSPLIGLEGFHVAKLLTDSANGQAAYEESIAIPHVREIGIKPQNSNAILYADNQAVDSASATSEYELTINTASLPLEYKAYLLGHKLENGIMTAGKDDVAPYFAVMFACNKKNGKKRYCKFLKVQFMEPDESPQTKADKLEYNTPSFSGKAIYRSSDGLSYQQADEELADFTAEMAAKWYTEV